MAPQPLHPRARAATMKDGDEEYERFDVENDFEGGQWIGGEYFYKNKRQKRQQTEEDRLYGIFAEDDSEDEGRGRRGRRGGGAGRSDFTKPVNFVSRGRVDPGMDDMDEETKVGEAQVGPGRCCFWRRRWCWPQSVVAVVIFVVD